MNRLFFVLTDAFSLSDKKRARTKYVLVTGYLVSVGVESKITLSTIWAI